MDTIPYPLTNAGAVAFGVEGKDNVLRRSRGRASGTIDLRDLIGETPNTYERDDLRSEHVEE